MKSKAVFVALLFLMLTSCASTTPSDPPPKGSGVSDDIDASPQASQASPASQESPPPSSSQGDIELPPVTEPPLSVPSPSAPVSSAEPSASEPPPPDYMEVTPPAESERVTFSEKVTPSLSELTFEIDVMPHGDMFHAQGITVHENGRHVQDIALIDHSANSLGIFSLSPEMDFEFMDVNFDGYTDFRIRDFDSRDSNGHYLFFLWEPGSRQFVFSPEVSSLSSPEPDNDSRTVSGKIILFPDVVESEYVWEQGNLVIQEERISHYEEADSVWHVMVMRRVDGAMTVVEEYVDANDPYAI